MKWPRGGALLLALTADQLLARLATLVPPPRTHAVRYHGVFAPHARWRARVVPAAEPAPPAARPCSPPRKAAPPAPQDREPAPKPGAVAGSDGQAGGRASPYRVPWAELLQKVFAVDVLACPRCDARLEVIAYVNQPEVAKQILDHLGLASQGPPVASARAPPDAEPARPDARGGRVPLQAPCPRPGVVETRPRRAGELTQAIDEYGPSGAGGAAAYVEKAEVERARGARREVLQLPCPLPGRVRGLTGF